MHSLVVNLFGALELSQLERLAKVHCLIVKSWNKWNCVTDSKRLKLMLLVDAPRYGIFQYHQLSFSLMAGRLDAEAS